MTTSPAWLYVGASRSTSEGGAVVGNCAGSGHPLALCVRIARTAAVSLRLSPPSATLANLAMRCQIGNCSDPDGPNVGVHPGWLPGNCAAIQRLRAVMGWRRTEDSPRLSCAQPKGCGKRTPRGRRIARQCARPRTPKRRVAVEIPGIGRRGTSCALYPHSRCE